MNNEKLFRDSNYGINISSHTHASIEALHGSTDGSFQLNNVLSIVKMFWIDNDFHVQSFIFNNFLDS